MVRGTELHPFWLIAGDHFASSDPIGPFSIRARIQRLSRGIWGRRRLVRRVRRIIHPPRIGWEQKVEQLGLLFHSPGGAAYWNESAHYEFDAEEIERLEKATNELAQMCLDVVEDVLARDRFADLKIPSWVVPAIRQSWDDDHPSVYGRFDLGFDGKQVKLLEYNADTPTSLLEAAVVQWHWLEEVEPEADQFNDIWEALVAKWTELRTDPGLTAVTFASGDLDEDVMTTTVLRDTAQEAGLATQHIGLGDIGWDAVSRRFVDLRDLPIDVLFKLHPWEQLINDPFGAQAVSTYGSTRWIEPAWKLVLSNKAMLPLLWEKHPGHDLLLPAYLDTPHDLTAYVKKPVFGREGANVSVVRDGITVESRQGEYGEEGFVYQGLFELPSFDGWHPVIGSWVIDHAAHGIGIRETRGLVTDDLAQFVPHLFR